MKVLLAMSGGVDSSLCGHLLQEMGHEVHGVTFDTGMTDREKFKKDVEDAKAVAESLGFGHSVVEYKDYFRKNVVNPFIDAYLAGKTPNPCIICNRVLKFGTLMDYAISHGYDMLATGHYANVGKIGDRYLLKKAKDERKDQTYFMYGASNLDRVIFPLGGFTKTETRELAHKIGIKTMDKKDSQEVCFISTNYRDFLNSENVKLPAEGNFIDIDGNVLGKHEGTFNYTIGQRKGLNIALGARAYVIDIDTKNNTVTLGDESYLFKKTVVAKMPETVDANLLEDKVYEVKTRYKLHGDPARVRFDGKYLIGEFEKGVRAPAVGQSMVVYDGDYVITGGEIVDAY